LGDELDKLLRIKVLEYVAKGLPVNNIILKQITKKMLEENNKSELLFDNGGSLKLGDSWCQRFWERYELSNRVPTTKMRELPTDFAQKVW